MIKVSKEKTAKLFPNAVGVVTEDGKHVFGSLLSRDTTYKLMLHVTNYINDDDTSNSHDLVSTAHM